MCKCSICKIQQNELNSYLDKNSISGYQRYCRNCAKETRRSRYALNKYKEINRQLKYIKDNPDKNRAHSSKRRATKLKATPKWLNLQQKIEIKEFYSLANELQWLSNEPLHVDHIVPLKGKNVCGLHVPWNLQILPASENQKKSNN